MAMKNPPHIGSFIESEIIAPTGLTISAAAKVLGVSRPALSCLLNMKTRLSGEMAMRLEKAFGIDMTLLMEMQAGYEIAQARKRESQIEVQPFVPRPVTV